MRHIFITAAALMAAAAIVLPPDARATKAIAAVPKAAQFLGDDISPQERDRLNQRLQRDRFSPVGDLRRKGSLVILLAVQDGAPWRLVVDAPTGEIIGKRPLSETIAFPRKLCKVRGPVSARCRHPMSRA